MAGARTGPRPPVSFRARLERPADTGARATWCFIVLPSEASNKLPTRGIVSVTGSLQGHAFKANLHPDGQRSHWFKVPAVLCRATGVGAGEIVDVTLMPSIEQFDDPLPRDLRRALGATPQALSQWRGLTPSARRDWILWVTTAKSDATRARRIAAACDMLASGKRRVCCFDRSGFYSKALGAPKRAQGFTG